MIFTFWTPTTYLLLVYLKITYNYLVLHLFVYCWMTGDCAKRSWYLLHLPSKAWCMYEGNNDKQTLFSTSIIFFSQLAFGIKISICLANVDICWLQCCYGHCLTTFHPSCARSAGLFIIMRTAGGKMQHKAYCEKHSSEQRAKVLLFVSWCKMSFLLAIHNDILSLNSSFSQAETQKHGVEELKSIKPIRVRLSYPFFSFWFLTHFFRAWYWNILSLDNGLSFSCRPASLFSLVWSAGHFKTMMLLQLAFVES